MHTLKLYENDDEREFNRMRCKVGFFCRNSLRKIVEILSCTMLGRICSTLKPDELCRAARYQGPESDESVTPDFRAPQNLGMNYSKTTFKLLESL